MSLAAYLECVLVVQMFVETNFVLLLYVYFVIGSKTDMTVNILN